MLLHFLLPASPNESKNTNVDQSGPTTASWNHSEVASETKEETTSTFSAALHAAKAQYDELFFCAIIPLDRNPLESKHAESLTDLDSSARE